MNELAIAFHDFYAFLLVFARISGMIVVSPLFGNRVLPLQVRAGMALFLSIMTTPLVVVKTGPIPDHLLVLVGQILGETMFGLALGYMTRVLFSAVEMAGYFVDTQMGFGFLTLINPFAEQQSSAMGTFQYQLAMTLYLLSNGHLLLLGALAESFQTLLPGGVTPGGAFGMTALPMLQQMMGLGFRLALPAAGVLFVVDVAFGLVARMVPQVNVFIVGIPAKIVLGLMTMALVLPAIALIVGDIVTGTMHSVDTLIRSVRVGH